MISTAELKPHNNLLLIFILIPARGSEGANWDELCNSRQSKGHWKLLWEGVR